MARGDYDYNIWSDYDAELTITAYKQFIDSAEGDAIRTIYDDYVSQTFKFPEDTKEIEYLLQDLAINHYPFTDYDDWVNNPLSFGNEAPPKVKAFLDALPDYEIETHDSRLERAYA